MPVKMISEISKSWHLILKTDKSCQKVHQKVVFDEKIENFGKLYEVYSQIHLLLEKCSKYIQKTF